MLKFLRFFSYLNQLWTFILIVLCVHRFAGVCWVCPAALNVLNILKAFYNSPGSGDSKGYAIWSPWYWKVLKAFSLWRINTFNTFKYQGHQISGTLESGNPGGLIRLMPFKVSKACKVLRTWMINTFNTLPWKKKGMKKIQSIKSMKNIKRIKSINPPGFPDSKVPEIWCPSWI
jgi:hypothetical protein